MCSDRLGPIFFHLGLYTSQEENELGQTPVKDKIIAVTGEIKIERQQVMMKYSAD